MRDLSIAVDRFPVPGETRVGRDALEAHGGKGSNQAVQAARCGAQVAIAACVGDDAAGDAARAFWRGEGLATEGVAVQPGAATGLAAILVDDRGQNQIVIAPGANACLGVDAIERAAAQIAAAELVIAQLETPIDATLRAFALARAAGRTTLLNTAPAPHSLPDALWAATDILVANELEGAALAGLPPHADPVAVGRALLTRVRVAVVITLGERGAMLFAPGRAPLHQSALSVQVVDSTGAGDAFVGAFAASWAGGGTDPAGEPSANRGASPDPRAEGALRAGVAAGSLACTRRGVAPALADAAAIARATRTLEETR